MKAREFEERLIYAATVCRSAGRGLMALRGASITSIWVGGQLKSAADLASENWVLSLIKSKYPKEPILAEEKYEDEKSFKLKGNIFWTVDALDGTRSFHEGFDGFCVQVALILNKKVELGVVYWPAKDITYFAIKRKGAFKIEHGEKYRLKAKKISRLQRYVDNSPASGRLLRLISELGCKKYIESGSFGLKLCKVAEGAADLFIKKSKYKLWDLAPGDLILSESGYAVTEWDGKPIVYDQRHIVSSDVIATSIKNLPIVIKKLNANK